MSDEGIEPVLRCVALICPPPFPHRARYQIARAGEVGEGAEAKVGGCRRMCPTTRP